MTLHIPFDNSYARLGSPFHLPLAPMPVAAPRLIALNRDLALELGLDPEALARPEALAWFAGNQAPEGAEPIATAYAGHQFGGFVPQLGDGRAMLLGEIVDRHGTRRDLQLKGSGRTPFSRGGDGRAALGPVLREYIVSEAMAALGIPTTRALAAVATGEDVYRETVLPGAVLTRVASSHIRIGTFQFFAARGDEASLRRLADHVIARHYGEAGSATDPYLALLQSVVERQASLIARWMLVGFVHGVMNTDNASIAGETIDYGPCAFMDTYDPATVFSSIDRGGRYAYANQPGIAHWNLVRFAECLLPLLGDDEARAVESAEQVLSTFPALYEAALLDGARAKLGLAIAQPDDKALWDDLLDGMAAGQADFTVTFRSLCAAADGDPAAARGLFAEPARCDAWIERWRRRLAEETVSSSDRAAAMRRVNPAFIPRNHQVEAVIEAAVERQDFEPFARLGLVLSRPYDAQPSCEAFATPPAERQPYRTFCGT
jgi:uncharacterized protein YdiU (UPF0061 family)